MLHGVIPIILFTLAAVHNTKPILIKTGRVLKLSRFQMVRWILFPAAIPEIFTGLRVGFALTLIGSLLAEMFASQRGLGYLLMNGIGLHNVELIMAVTFIIVVFAASVSSLLLYVDHRLHRRSLKRRDGVRVSAPVDCGAAGRDPTRADRRALRRGRERLRDEARRLHVFDERAQIRGGNLAAARRPHRLVDRHEASRQKAQARNAPRVGLERGPHAGRDVELLRDEDIDDILRGDGADERCVPDRPRQKEIVRAARAHQQAHAGPIDFGVVAKRRSLGDEICAFDHDIGRREEDLLGREPDRSRGSRCPTRPP